MEYKKLDSRQEKL